MRKNYLIVSIAIFVIFSSLATATFFHFYQFQRMPIAKNGVLDLRQWDFEENGPVRLNGEWNFFWNQLLTPEETAVRKRTGVIQVPAKWSSESAGVGPLPAIGYGTYQLRIRLPENSEKLGIQAENIYSSFEIYGDQQQLLRVGKPATNKEAAQERRVTEIAFLPSNGKTLLLTIPVSNYTHKKSGIWQPINFGLYSDLKKSETLSISIGLFSFGGLLVMGIHYFGLYFHRKEGKRKEKDFLIFSAMCFIFALRALFIGSRFVLRMFPEFPLLLEQKITYLTFYLLPPLFVLFFDQIFPKEKRELYTKGAVLYFSILIVTTLIGNRMIIAWTGNFGNFGTVVVCFWSLVRVSRVIWKNRDQKQEAIFLVFGTSVLVPIVINDILSGLGLINTSELGALGMLFFLVTMSMILSKRYSQASVMIRKQNLKLQRLNKVKDHFLANTSHELRTPLHAITGISESLLETCRHHDKSGSISKNISLIHSSAQYLANLVNDILDTTILKYQKLKMSPVSLNLYPIVQGILDFHIPAIRKRELELVNKVPTDAPTILADELRLRQILQNLLSNAIKFTTEGTIEIEAKQEGKLLAITVRDTGIGIENKYLETIFQAFEQINPNRGGKKQGTGLGLYITKKLIKLHEGTITVESKPGQGSAFTFTLPLSNQPAKNGPVCFSNAITNFDEKKSMVNLQNGMEHSPRWNILVVDDDPINLHVVCEFLTGGEYHPIPCASGEEALKEVERKTPDLVLLDVMMPGIDGFEICKIIRKKHTSDQLPIIFLTACNDAARLIQGYDVGGDDYLTKPFPKTKLIASIAPLLKKNIQKEQKIIDPKILLQLGTVVSNIEQTLFIQASENYCMVHMAKNKAEIIRLPLKKMKLHFDDSFLLQIHRSYLINPAKIKGIKKNKKSRYTLQLNGTKEAIPIGQKYLTNLHSFFPEIINDAN